jgi:signal transduction histidine kinase
MIALYRWLTRDISKGDGSTAPAEAIALRAIGVIFVVVFVAETITTKPRPGLHGKGLVVLLATLALVGSALLSSPRHGDMPTWRRVIALLRISVAAGVLAAVQPHGIWAAGPYYVGIVAALRLERVAGLLVILSSLVLLAVASALAGNGGGITLPLAAIPWFLLMRLMSELRRQRDELDVARVAEARAAASAERGRLAREMHDVLAHSLSSLALQLETTRLLARDRDVDADVTAAIDQAHHLAAAGLDEARRAIATARGEDLPGPERIGALAEAFGEQSGLPVAVDVSGDPRELAPDARLAVYRTAQEALTNVRRHAAPERVELRLAYLPDSTVLVIEDHAADGMPPPAGLGLTGSGYGLTGMRERAELLGGELRAEPTGDGFRVELRLPL